MCGIGGVVGGGFRLRALEAMVSSLRPRGPDDAGTEWYSDRSAGLAHTRLRIVDLSDAGHQPMTDPDGRYHIVYNGEVYNHEELRTELGGTFTFRSRTDTEVVLAAWLRWGPACLDQFIGMFAFAIWDIEERTLFAARDRFGVKPLYLHHGSDAAGTRTGSLWFASQVSALLAAGVPRTPNDVAWASYLANGIHDFPDGTRSETFFNEIEALPPGCWLRWQDGRARVTRWYDLPSLVQTTDDRPVETVIEDVRNLMVDSIRLRLRADVPVGINLSGGLDSSLLFGLTREVRGDNTGTHTYTFVTGDEAYDESPWVEQMLAGTPYRFTPCPLLPGDVPEMTAGLHEWEPLPFGGIPNLAYARTFQHARSDNVPVLLDGQGVDEQWAGYDYYARALAGTGAAPTVQGASRALRPECLVPGFRESAVPLPTLPPGGDRIRDLQLRDILLTKLPRALRYNDRISMLSSIELREPFLDHRLVELALRQPPDRKIRGGVHKWLPRQIAAGLLPAGITLAPKRPVQTPQREWLRGPLREWAKSAIDTALREWSCFDSSAVHREWDAYLDGHGDNSYFVWQWISLGLLIPEMRECPASGNVQE